MATGREDQSFDEDSRPSSSDVTARRSYGGELICRETQIDMRMVLENTRLFCSQVSPGFGQFGASHNKRTVNKEQAWKNVITALKDKYSRETAWIWPLEFLPATMLKPRHFLDPKLYCTDYRGEGEDDLQLSKLLSQSATDERPPKRILIRGDSGFGKTTLCTMLAYYWAQESVRPAVFKDLSDFQLALFYCLKDLPDNSKIEDALIKEVVYYAGQGTTKEDMLPVIEENSSRILILLDGYDELPKERRELVDLFLHGDLEVNHCSVFRKATIIVTTRPIHGDVKPFRSVERYVKIAGLSEENQVEFVKTFFPKEVNLYANLKEKLDQTELGCLPRLSPLMLYIICFLVHEGDLVISETSVEAFSSQAIYEEICMLFARKCSTNERLDMEDEDIKNAFFEIGKMLYHPAGNKRPMYKATFHENQIIGKAQKFETLILNCGLVRKKTSTKFREPKDYEPIHPSFGTFFGGLYVSEAAKTLSTDQEVMAFIGHPQVLSNTVHTALTQRGKSNACLSFLYFDCDAVLKINVNYFGEPNKQMKVEVFRKEAYMKWANEAFPNVDELLETDNVFKTLSETKQHGRKNIFQNHDPKGAALEAYLLPKIEKTRNEDEQHKHADASDDDIVNNDNHVNDNDTPVISVEEAVFGTANMREGIQGNDIKLLNDSIDSILVIKND